VNFVSFAIGPGNDTIELEAIFHEYVVFSFTMNAPSVYFWKGLKSVLNYRIDKRLLRLKFLLLYHLTGLCFGLVSFRLIEVSNHGVSINFKDD
jgi:hypothetical protein